MELRWIASSSASCLHVAGALVRRQSVAEPALAEALAEPVKILETALAEHGLSAGRLWPHLMPLAAVIENNRELAAVALTKAFGQKRSAPAAEGLARAIASLEAAFTRAKPDAIDELELRSGPLIEQWEARGPGLLAALGRLTQNELLVERADVVLVHPVRGGAGSAHLAYNVACIEAVLVNPAADLPEVVRLGWLLAQLNLDLPLLQGDLSREDVARLGALALAPAALAAGQEVELTTASAAQLARALTTWHADKGGNDSAGSAGRNAAQLAEVVWTWWETYNERHPAWPTALAALSQMLSAG